jgi:tetratricopeptide (TPR) repeat protein
MSPPASSVAIALSLATRPKSQVEIKTGVSSAISVVADFTGRADNGLPTTRSATVAAALVERKVRRDSWAGEGIFLRPYRQQGGLLLPAEIWARFEGMSYKFNRGNPGYRKLLVVVLSLLVYKGVFSEPAETNETFGDRLLGEGRYYSAVQAYELAVRRQPKWADLHRKLARAYAMDERLPQAVEAYERAIALRTNFAKARTELAILLIRLDRHDDAVQTLEQAIELDPGYAWAHMSLGLIHASKGRYDQATTAYRHAIEALPEYGEAWFNLGQVHLKKKDHEAAEEAFNKAVAADSTAARYRNGLATSYYRRREYAAAAAELVKAVRLDSLYAKARFNLGNALLRTGKRDEGRRQLDLYRRLEEEEREIAAMKNTLLTAPDRAEIYHDIGAAYARRGQFSQAQSRYLQAIARDSTFAPSYHNLGNIKLREGQVSKAIRLFRSALRADSTYVLSHLALGNAHMRSRQVSQALESYRRGLLIDPNNPRLQRNAAMAEQILSAGTEQGAGP